MKNIASFLKWLAIMTVFVLVLWIPMATAVHYLEKKSAGEPSETAWFSATEGHRLMRYHGTVGLKITSDRVFIRQDGKWIEVLKRKPA